MHMYTALAIAAGLLISSYHPAIGCGAPASASALARPTFAAAPGSPRYVGPMAGRPAVGDVNGDGAPDVVVACGTCCGSRPDPKSGHVVVLLGKGDGTFDDAPGSPIKIASSVRKVALGDFNGDQRIDIAAAEHDSYGLTVLLGDGRGGFAPAPSSPVASGDGPGAHTHAIAAADVNGDGASDLLATSANDGVVNVLLGNGRGGFSRVAPAPAGRHPYDEIVPADMNRDGKLDLVVPDLAGHAIIVNLGDGKGGFAPRTSLRVGERPGYVAVGDVNRDGAMDVLATHDDVGMVDVLLGDGTGGLRAAPGSPVTLGPAVWGVAVAELNGDGNPDLALGSFGRGNREVVVLLGDGRGGFEEAKGLGLEAGDSPGYVVTADMNRDGRTDLVTGNYGSGDIAVFLSRSAR